MSKYFPRNVLKLSVAQLSQGFNYEAADNSALDFLTDVLIAFIEEIAYHAHMYAQLDKRVESNFSDIIKALEDHRIHFKDILEYYNNVDDVSLVRDIPKLYFDGPSLFIPEKYSENMPPHIPSFLPPFPTTTSTTFNIENKKGLDLIHYVEEQYEDFDSSISLQDDYDTRDDSATRDDSSSLGEQLKKRDYEELHSEVAMDPDDEYSNM